MTLANTVREKLSEWRPPAGRQDLTIGAGAAGLTLTVDRREELGCLVWELTVRRMAPGDTLAAWADRVAKRVTSLLEPLKVLEIDVERNEALLRSEQSASRDNMLSYCEVILKGTKTATLRRY